MVVRAGVVRCTYPQKRAQTHTTTNQLTNGRAYLVVGEGDVGDDLPVGDGDGVVGHGVGVVQEAHARVHARVRHANDLVCVCVCLKFLF